MTDTSAEVITAGTQAVQAGTWPWIVAGLVVAIGYLARHFVRRHEQDRSDRKEEREALLQVVRENAQVIKDNTVAMVELKTVVAHLHKAFDVYARQEH